MVHVIVERTFQKPLSVEELAVVEARMKPCFELYRVEWLRSYWSTDRRRMICVYRAPDAGAVRDLQQEAEAQFDRVWTSDLRQPA
jgi:hypothetical protein